MAKPVKPRSGSMQFWPRVRANKPVPRIRSWAASKEAKPLAFAGYKAGMTHVLATDARAHSTSKGQDISIPVTVIECPPMRIYSVRGYKAKGYGYEVVKEIILGSDKDLPRKVGPSKKKPSPLNLKEDDAEFFTITLFTQPRKIGFKKKPDLFEVRLGGTPAEQLTYITEHKDKDLLVHDFLAEGDLVDARAVTTGKGFQGAVKRFGIGLKSHKSEKGRRTPGSLGGWKGQAHFMYRVAHAGQTGYHQRIQYNNQILKIGDAPEEVNPSGAFIRYGNVKNTYVLIKGSIPGPKKRLIVLAKPLKPRKAPAKPTIQLISTASQQGR